MTATVLLVDDHGIVRDGLRSLLERDDELEVVGEAEDGRAAVAMAGQLTPDLVLMDVWMPSLSGIEATRQIVSSGIDCRVLMLSQHDRWDHVRQALEAGAAGYVLKSALACELLDAIVAVRRGRTYLSPEIAGDLVGAVVSPGSSVSSGVRQLTNREREVLLLIAEGLSSKEIATELGVSPRTVETHRASLMDKLGIHKVSGLVRFAIHEGLIAP